MRALGRIHEAFVCDLDGTDQECARCLGTGYVCEDHPDKVWEGIDERGCECGRAGMPCSESSRRAPPPSEGYR